MIKIKLDPSNRVHMKALALLAGELAQIEEPLKSEPKEPKKDPEAEKPEPKKEAPAKKPAAKKEEPKKEPEAHQNEKTSEVSLDDIREVIAEKKDKHLEAMRDKLLNDYKVPNVTKLKPSDYDEFFAFISKL